MRRDWHCLADVVVIDGPTNTMTTKITTGTNPVAIAANIATNKIYVANAGQSFCHGHQRCDYLYPLNIFPCPRFTAIAVNAVTDNIYVASSRDTVTVINGDTNATSKVLWEAIPMESP